MCYSAWKVESTGVGDLVVLLRLVAVQIISYASTLDVAYLYDGVKQILR